MKDVEKLVDSNGVVLQIVDGAARDMIAAEYDETKSYAVGDYCIYNDHYYKCTTAIPSGGETWDATHWSATTLGAENKAINTNLSNLIQYVLIEGTTSNSGALALPSAVVNGAILDMYYEGAGVNGFINRRDKNYLTCYDNNLNIKASTAVKIHCYYTPVS